VLIVGPLGLEGNAFAEPGKETPPTRRPRSEYTPVGTCARDKLIHPLTNREGQRGIAGAGSKNIREDGDATENPRAGPEGPAGLSGPEPPHPHNAAWRPAVLSPTSGTRPCDATSGGREREPHDLRGVRRLGHLFARWGVDTNAVS
jgi:hypothetical protein